MKLLNFFSSLVITVLAAVLCVSALAQVTATGTASGEVTSKCKYPQQPSIPNGTKANMEDMMAAQKAVKAYQTDAQNYRTCVDGVMSAWDSSGATPEEIGEKKGIAVEFYNRSVADEEEVANMFNSAIRAFKGKPKN